MEDLYGLFLYAIVIRRSYAEYTKLNQLYSRYRYAYTLQNIVKWGKSVPERKFIEFSAIGMMLDHKIRVMVDFHEKLIEEHCDKQMLLDQKKRMRSLTIDDLFIEIHPNKELAADMVLNASCAREREGKLYSSGVECDDIYSYVLNGIFDELPERKELIKRALIEDDPEMLTTCLNEFDRLISNNTMTKYVLALALYSNAIRCVEILMIHPLTHEAVDTALYRMRYCSYDNNMLSKSFDFLRELNKECLMPDNMFDALYDVIPYYAAKNGRCFSTLYDQGKALKNIPERDYHKFRYTAAIGAFMHLNIDMYRWVIDLLYNFNEMEFITELYARTSVMRDEYDSSDHAIIEAYKAYHLYESISDTYDYMINEK